VIPTIEQILSDLFYHRMTVEDAQKYIDTHLGCQLQGTLRDRFAAKAMAALMADWRQAMRDSQAMGVNPLEGVASTAYTFADAMLKARDQ
jgi:hypothetical protein